MTTSAELQWDHTQNPFDTACEYRKPFSVVETHIPARRHRHFAFTVWQMGWASPVTNCSAIQPQPTVAVDIGNNSRRHHELQGWKGGSVAPCRARMAHATGRSRTGLHSGASHRGRLRQQYSSGTLEQSLTSQTISWRFNVKLLSLSFVCQDKRRKEWLWSHLPRTPSPHKCPSSHLCCTPGSPDRGKTKAYPPIQKR